MRLPEPPVGEEFDVERQRQVGNFPKAFSRLMLIGAATSIATGAKGVSV